MGVLNAVRYIKWRVYMITCNDVDDRAIDFHLPLAADDVVVLIESAFFVAIVQVMNVNTFARTRGDVINNEVCRCRVSVENKPLNCNRSFPGVDGLILTHRTGF